LYLGQCVCNAIFNGKCNVLDAATTTVLLDELGDCTLVARCLEQLNLGLTYLEKRGLYLLVGYLFDSETLET